MKIDNTTSYSYRNKRSNVSFQSNLEPLYNMIKYAEREGMLGSYHKKQISLLENDCLPIKLSLNTSCQLIVGADILRRFKRLLYSGKNPLYEKFNGYEDIYQQFKNVSKTDYGYRTSWFIGDEYENPFKDKHYWRCASASKLIKILDDEPNLPQNVKMFYKQAESAVVLHDTFVEKNLIEQANKSSANKSEVQQFLKTIDEKLKNLMKDMEQLNRLL